MSTIITYLNVQQVARRLNVSKATIWRWKAAGTFSTAVKISTGTTRWRLTDIEAWEATLNVCLVTDLSMWSDRSDRSDDRTVAKAA